VFIFAGNHTLPAELVNVIRWPRYRHELRDLFLGQTSMTTINYRLNMQKMLLIYEYAFVCKILEYCVQNGEIVPCDVQRVANSILAVAEAYKHEVIENPILPPDAPIDYSAIEDDMVYTVLLIINGLKRPGSV
jgi:hypothetical protein